MGKIRRTIHMLSTGLGNPYFSTFSSDHVAVSVAYALVSLAYTGPLAMIICLSATIQNPVGNAKANIQNKEGISSLRILHLLPGLRRGKQIYMKTIADTTVTLDLANQQFEDYHILLHSLRGGMQILVMTLADKTFISDAYAMFLQLCLPGDIQIYTKTLTAIYLESTFHLVPRLRGGMHIYALEDVTTTLDAELHSLCGATQILAKTLADKIVILDAYALSLQLCLPRDMQIFTKTLTAIYSHLLGVYFPFGATPQGRHAYPCIGRPDTTLDAEASDTPANVQAKIPSM